MGRRETTPFTFEMSGAPPSNPPPKRDESSGKKGVKSDKRRRKKKDEVKEVVLTDEQIAYLKQKHIDERCTRLRFINKGGKVDERFFDMVRCEHYSELQRLIAKSKPKTTSLFMCQFEDGSILTSENFKQCSIYRVRDMETVRPLNIKYCPRVDTRWDFLEFHAGKPPGWHDKLQDKYDLVLKIKHDEQRKRDREQDAIKLMERLQRGGDEEPDGADWDDL